MTSEDTKRIYRSPTVEELEDISREVQCLLWFLHGGKSARFS